MPFEVNPFEPWRPRRDDNGPPGGEDEARQHWQPPTDPPPEPADEDEPDPEWYRQPQAPEPVWTRRREKRDGSAQGFAWVTIPLVVAALIVWGVNGGSHVTRVAAALGVVWLGLLLAWPLGRRWHWHARLGWAAAGLAGMVACWWWVPTMGGVSLWDAERALERAGSLAVSDVAGFQAGTAERAAVAYEFPRLRNEVQAVERRWFRNTARQEMKLAEQERSRDPAAAVARLRSLHGLLQGRGPFGRLHAELHEGRRQALKARMDHLEARLADLTRQGRYSVAANEAREAEAELSDEARALGMEVEVQGKLREVRIRNLRVQLRGEVGGLERLLRGGKDTEVAAAGRRLEAALGPEARALGEEGMVRAQIRGVRRRAIVARTGRALAELNGLLEKGQDEAVAARARQHEKELGEEASAVAAPAPAEVLLPARRTALGRRAARAGKVLEELLKKKEFAAVATRGGELIRELEPEAAQVEKDSAWRSALMGLRRKALAARLDQARVAVRALLAKSQYQAMSEAGEKALKDLGLEAEAVGLSKEVLDFRNLCRFYARLAKDGNVEDGK